VHQEVPDEEAEVEIIGALVDWYEERFLAVRRRGRQKKQT
jgi:hypothetical protein